MTNNKKDPMLHFGGGGGEEKNTERAFPEKLVMQGK